MNRIPLDHDQTLRQLEELLDRRRIASARALAEQALLEFPDSPALLQASAWIDWMEDRLDEAEATLDRVLELDPESFDARYLLSRIYTETDRLAEAEQILVDLLRANPESARLYADYASLMLETFHLAKAERLAAEALRLEPQDESALHVAVMTAFVNQPGPETERRLQRLLEEYPDQFSSAVRLAQALTHQGRIAEAYELARQLVQQQPDNEDLVEMASDLRHAAHWTMKPMWPMQKFGWAGSIGLYVVMVAVLGSGVFEGTSLESLVQPLALAFLLYVVYSWTWPPLLRRILR